MTPTQLGRVQLLIMQVLWQKKTATAREITDVIGQLEPIAHSTVQTLLRSLEDKGAISHSTQGRTFVFTPLIRESEFQTSATRDLLNRVFRGKPEQLVAHLLDSETLSANELDEIRKLIDRSTQERGGHDA